ncbi:MAG TPA: MFS transporter [Candidatus Angelobacter sp.]|nr:MFS transporter [Candidatus Angelobacter sp.]
MRTQEAEELIPATTEPRQESSSRRALFFLSLAELLAMSLWFTGTAVLPQVTGIWRSDLSLGSWLTIAVQIGFAAGALTFALFNIPDIFSPVTVLMVSSVAAGAANAAFAMEAAHPVPAILSRALTGFFLAGVYPTGMKIIAGWFQRGRGLALGIMIGALSVASAVPHGVNSLGGIPWRGVVLTCSVFSLLAAVVVGIFVREGPYAVAQSRLDLSQVWEIVRNRRVRLANLGYLGHMWELYAMWGWIAVVLAASGGWPKLKYELGATLVIAIGAVGCIWAGAASDRLQNSSESARIAQRAKVTIIAMSVSAACCVLAALVFHHTILLLLVSLVWGISVIADSAQFSAIISEVSEKRYVGTALTIQTAFGFLLTAISIRATASLAALFGSWQWALATLSIGPLLGIWAMRGLTKMDKP